MKMNAEIRRFNYALFCTLIPCTILTLCIFVLYYFFFSSGLTLSLSYWFASLPVGIRAFYYILAALDMSDPLVFFARFFQPVYFILTLASCIIGGRCMNSDEGGILELWRNIPISRSGLFIRRYLGGMGVIALTNAVLLGITIGCYCFLFQPSLAYISVYGVMFLRMAVVQAIFFSICSLYSAISHNAGRSTFWSIMTMLVLWGLAIVPSFFYVYPELMYVALPYYGIPEYAFKVGPYYSYWEGGIMGGVVSATALAGLLVYRHKQYYLGK